MSTLKAVRGTRDLLPPETALWNRIEATARDVFARYNFGEIRTPVFEDTQLFARGVGEETDIVSKEMYTWEDRERFDESLLVSHWLKSCESKLTSHQRRVRIGDQIADLLTHENVNTASGIGRLIQLVEFKSEFRKQDV